MKIVVLDGKVLNPGDVSWEPLRALGEVVVYDETSREEMPARVKDCDVLLVNKVHLGRSDMSVLSHVRLIGLLATGYDNVEVEAFAERGVPVCNVVAYGVEDVSQHTMAMLLELCRHITLHSESVKSGEWERCGSWCYWKKTPVCLAGLTMGIIGFGTIGRSVGRLAHAFGMKVIACSRTKRDIPVYTPFAFVSKEELFASSDVISLHCPLTPETRGIITARTIAAMRRGAFVLNTARGPLLDEAACAEALISGQLGGLATDVLSVEPPRNNPLLSAPNTLITPHIAWATTRARQNIIDLMAENIANWAKGTPTNVVNRPL